MEGGVKERFREMWPEGAGLVGVGGAGGARAARGSVAVNGWRGAADFSVECLRGGPPLAGVGGRVTCLANAMGPFISPPRVSVPAREPSAVRRGLPHPSPGRPGSSERAREVFVSPV